MATLTPKYLGYARLVLLLLSQDRRPWPLPADPRTRTPTFSAHVAAESRARLERLHAAQMQFEEAARMTAGSAEEARARALEATWGGREMWQDPYAVNEIVSLDLVPPDFSYVVLCDSEMVSGH
jgi:hypothetical protein